MGTVRFWYEKVCTPGTGQNSTEVPSAWTAVSQTTSPSTPHSDKRLTGSHNLRVLRKEMWVDGERGSGLFVLQKSFYFEDANHNIKICLRPSKTQKAWGVSRKIQATVTLPDFTEISQKKSRSSWSHLPQCPSLIFIFPSQLSSKTRFPSSSAKTKPSSYDLIPFFPACS